MRGILFCAAILTCSPLAGKAGSPPLEVYFSPNGGCTAAIVEEISHAKKTLLVQAYSFTSREIAQALIDAQKRGVNVRVLLDKSQERDKRSVAKQLLAAAIEVWVDDKPRIAHSKVMIIDGRTVLTGSFNFTKSAELANVENLVVLRNKATASLYGVEWEERLKLSRRMAELALN